MASYIFAAQSSHSSMDRIVVSGTTDGGSNPSGNTWLELAIPV